MEIFSFLLIVLLGLVFLKIIAFLFKAGFFVLSLPFKLLGAAFCVLGLIFILMPLGLVAGLAVLGSLLPVVLILIGLVVLLRNS